MGFSEAINKAKYISFDVFDTLIKRSVAMPTDVFLLMEQYCANTGMNIPAGFSEKRREAQRRAAERKGTLMGIDDIYEELRREYGDAADELKSLEFQFELEGCQPNSPCMELFHRCVEEGKMVLLISDMYLPSVFIGEMLEKCGITGYEKLYVSCEVGARKGDGSLYRAVMEDINIRPKELFHIGDNWKADYLRPVTLGIKAAHVAQDQKKLCKSPKGLSEGEKFTYRTLQACIRNCSQGMSEYEKMGCKIFGPQLYGFSQWLLACLRKEDIHDVYFLSRDGYTMKQAFDELRVEDIKTHYLYCSRRAYQTALLWKHSAFEEVIRSFLQVGRMTIRRFLLAIGLQPDNYAKTAGNFGLALDHAYEKGSFYTDKTVKEFYESIRADAEKNSKEEYDALVAYLRTFDMQNKIAVVDIGYRGTMQFALEELIAGEGWDIQVHGYYVNVEVDAPYIKNGDILAQGYFNENPNGAEIIKKEQWFKRIFEIQYLAQHGSVKRFEIDENGESRPVFLPYEYQKDSQQKINEAAVIGEYQSGAVRLIKYMLNAIPFRALSVNPDTAAYNFIRLGTAPTLREAQFWGDMRFENYGVTFIALPRNLWYYLIHWRDFKEDFLTCGWKIGFLKRMFRIPLPYERLLSMLKGIYYLT